MKKNVETENKNEVMNNEQVSVETSQVTNEELEQFVKDNDNWVPKNQRKKFDAMTLNQKAAKIKFWQDMQKMRDESGVFACNYYVTGAWDKVEALYVDDNEEENLVKKKGKYVKTREFFHDLFSEDGDHPLPVEIHYRYYYDQELEYVIELEDDEEFDIKKVQLVKSDYEVPEFPYFILCQHILYDGKEIVSNDEFNDWAEYCPEEKCYNTDVIDSYVNDPE